MSEPEGTGLHCRSQNKPFLSTYSGVNGKIVPCSKVHGSELVQGASEHLSYGEKCVKQGQERNLPIRRGQRQEPPQNPATPPGSQPRFGCTRVAAAAGAHCGTSRARWWHRRDAGAPGASQPPHHPGWVLGEGSKEELAHLPINDAFALQEEEADGYFCCVESEMKDLRGRLIIKGDESK